MERWTGVEELTRVTLDHLKNHAMQILWAAAQNNAADIKSTKSVEVGMEYFRRSLGLDAVPLVPGLTSASFLYHFLRCFDEISKVWNLADRQPTKISRFRKTQASTQERKLLQKKSIRFKVLSAIFNRNAWAHLTAKALDIVGPVDAAFAASDFAKVVAGITLIHDELFVMQQSQRRDGNEVTPLTISEIERAINSFCESDLRSVMTASIDGQWLVPKCYSKEEMGKAILKAIEVARAQTRRSL